MGDGCAYSARPAITAEQTARNTWDTRKLKPTAMGTFRAGKKNPPIVALEKGTKSMRTSPGSQNPWRLRQHRARH
eukprot:9451316-Pyramimonas_sp.AAC.1